MSKRKFKRGEPVKSLDDYLKHDWFIINGKTFSKGWCRSWPIDLAQEYINRGVAYIAVKLTNGEYYDGKSDDEIKDMLEEDLCEYCPLPDECKGVHCYGGQPVMCEGTHCDEAVEAWKEEEYSQ